MIRTRINFIWLISIVSLCLVATNQSPQEWAIVGAGPAGICVIGVLLDLGIPEKNISWIDPEFNVGRLGQHYQNVPANTQNRMFIHFLNSCKIFCKCDSPSMTYLYNLDPDKEYELKTIVEPLKDITDYLCTQVVTHTCSMTSLDYKNGLWNIGLQDNSYVRAKNVILATGSRPRVLNYECNTIIPLDIALDRFLLEKHIQENDSIAVIGGAHSAILILKFLSEMNVARILNFYTKPLEYSVEVAPDVTPMPNGLSGIAARWAYHVLDKDTPPNILRIRSTDLSRKAWLPICNKIIYACGYDRNDLPVINGSAAQELQYNSSNGTIAPHIWGIGIAFPETTTYPDGYIEYKIGLNDFMDYAQTMIPFWMKKKEPFKRFISFEKLFTIVRL